MPNGVDAPIGLQPVAPEPVKNGENEKNLAKLFRPDTTYQGQQLSRGRSMARRPTPDEARLLLEEATLAARTGDAPRMLSALDRSGFLDGLVYRLRSQWPTLAPFEHRDIVARAVDAAYSFVAEGGKVANLGAWLWKSAHHIATAQHRDHYDRRGTHEELEAATAPEPQTEAERAEQDDLDEFRRAEAVRVARSLLPCMGDGHLRDVMEMVVEAAAAGNVDLPASEIGEALGLDADAVRSLMSRGFKRLGREAEKAGIRLPDELPNIIADHTDEEE